LQLWANENRSQTNVAFVPFSLRSLRERRAPRQQATAPRPSA